MMPFAVRRDCLAKGSFPCSGSGVVHAEQPRITRNEDPIIPGVPSDGLLSYHGLPETGWFRLNPRRYRVFGEIERFIVWDFYDITITVEFECRSYFALNPLRTDNLTIMTVTRGILRCPALVLIEKPCTDEGIF